MKNKGFTLIEIMIVVAIISVIGYWLLNKEYDSAKVLSIKVIDKEYDMAADRWAYVPQYKLRIRTTVQYPKGKVVNRDEYIQVDFIDFNRYNVGDKFEGRHK